MINNNAAIMSFSRTLYSVPLLVLLHLLVLCLSSSLLAPSLSDDSFPRRAHLFCCRDINDGGVGNVYKDIVGRKPIYENI